MERKLICTSVRLRCREKGCVSGIPPRCRQRLHHILCCRTRAMRAAACCDSHRTAGGAHPAPTTARPEGGAKDEAANETAESIVVSGKDRLLLFAANTKFP